MEELRHGSANAVVRIRARYNLSTCFLVRTEAIILPLHIDSFARLHVPFAKGTASKRSPFYRAGLAVAGW